MDEMTLEKAVQEYEAKFGPVPMIVMATKGYPHEKIEQLLTAVDTNEPIVEPENIDDLVL